MADRAGWWRQYLLGDGGLGFDVLTWMPAYREFLDLQARLLEPQGRRVLDLGGGTGNLSMVIADAGPSRLVCGDLVPEALDRLDEKTAGRLRVDRQVVDADGNPWTAMCRWVHGEVAGPRFLARRIPGVQPALVNRVEHSYGLSLHSLLIGRSVDVEATTAASGLPPTDEPFLADLNLLARFVRGRIGEDEVRRELQKLSADALLGSRGLPWADGSFDRAALSLLLSYLDHPEDTLSEVYRVLSPGGVLVVSSMRPDADSSKLFLDLVRLIETTPEADLPGGLPRDELLRGARRFMGQASDLLRREEEGIFRFYSAEALCDIVRTAGFEDAEAHVSFGSPAQAVVVRCWRP